MVSDADLRHEFAITYQTDRLSEYMDSKVRKNDQRLHNRVLQGQTLIAQSDRGAVNK